jgi:Dolichyl-phosphate-mannose-protein mannosyltransferase
VNTGADAFEPPSVKPKMIATSPVLQPIGEEPWTEAALRVGRSFTWVLAYFLIAIILQTRTGAYKADFSGFSDSSAHHVTAIMMSQYLREGILQSPLAFAEQYYLHYPKVAIGHWPPFYYLCAGIWGLLFGVGHTSYLVFMALLAGLLAAVLRFVVRRDLGWWQGSVAGILLLLLPSVREGSQLMMLDTMVALLSLLAGYTLVQLLEKRTVWWAVMFGSLASLAILTKGTGMALAMVPLIVVVLTKRWEVVRRGIFWLPALVVVVVAAPWTILTLHSAKNGFEYEIGWAYTQAAGKGFFRFLVDATGPLLFVAAVYGVWLTIGKPFLRREVRPVWAMLFGLLISTYIFQAIVPASIEQRYLMAGFPSLAAFVIVGIEDVMGRLRERGWSRAVQVMVASAVMIVGLAAMRKPHTVHATGFGKLVEYVISRYSNYPKLAILVCSDSTGEGLVISEFAVRVPKPGPYFILRASKQLAKSDWMGGHYRVSFDDNESLKKYLESVPMTLILVDRSVDAEPFMEHVTEVESILAEGQGKWRLDSGWSRAQVNSEPKIELYAIEPKDYRSPAQISVDMDLMLGRKLRTPN